MNPNNLWKINRLMLIWTQYFICKLFIIYLFNKQRPNTRKKKFQQTFTLAARVSLNTDSGLFFLLVMLHPQTFLQTVDWISNY